MWAGSAPLAASTWVRWLTKLAWASWRPDTLTLTLMAGRSGKVSCHALDWRATSSSTQLPMGMMRPVSSSAGMNVVGARPGRGRGSFQRSSASTPTSRLVHSDTMGW